jgi:hypothetical protein
MFLGYVLFEITRLVKTTVTLYTAKCSGGGACMVQQVLVIVVTIVWVIIGKGIVSV